MINYVPEHLISLLKHFYYIFRLRYLIIKKPDSEYLSTQIHDFERRLSNYTSWKRFICLK